MKRNKTPNSSLHWQVAIAFQLHFKAHSSEKNMTGVSSAGLHYRSYSKKVIKVSITQVHTSARRLPAHTSSVIYQRDLKPARWGGVAWAEPRGLGGRGAEAMPEAQRGARKTRALGASSSVFKC